MRNAPSSAGHRRWLGEARGRLRAALGGRRDDIAQRRRLVAHPLFAGCTRGELRTLQRWGDEVEVPPGVVLLRERRIGTCLVAVLEGRLRQTTARRRTGTIAAGQWVGDLAVLGLGPEPATVRTETSCRLFLLGPRAVVSFAPSMSGMRAALFPQLDEQSARLRVRALREQGLARWQELRISPPPLPRKVSAPWLTPYGSSALGDRGDRFLALFGAPPDAPLPEPPVRRRRLAHPRRVAVTAGTSLVVALAVVATTVRIPYYSMRGGIRSATDAVRIDGAESTPGEILYPIVDVSQDTTLGALRDLHRDGVEVRTANELLRGPVAADVDRTNRWLMASSKHAAMRAVDELLGGAAPNETTVTIESGDIGGPSAGLAFALVLVDKRTPGDLTAGQLIAATGEIGSDGSVHHVGGIRLKTLAARRAGCTLLIIPRPNLAEAAQSAGAMRLLPVDTLAEAVQKLVADGGSISNAA